MQVDSFNLKHCARRIQVRMEYRSRFPESSSSFRLDTTFLNMDSQSRSQISAGARRSATAQKRKGESSTCCRASEQRSKQLRKRKERDRARRAAQTASEEQATSKWKSTRERERTAAETPEERETRLQQMRDRLQLAMNCHLHRT